MKVAANGLRVRAAVEMIPQLSDIAEVESVAPVTLHEPTNETSVPWIGAPEAWEAIDGTGEGVTIAVIDTGVDYTHLAMEGSGDTDEYDAILGDTTVIPDLGDGPVFPTAKVIDGFDFAGPDYDASGELGSEDPQPDPNPIDVHGHGTHVAGSAAGVEVVDPDDEDEVLIGSGVAPGASVYALKVFGDVAGSTALTADALEWAVDPQGDGSMEGRADVINMSLGSPFGHPGDPSAVATQNATEAGIVVVAAAGNSGHDAAYVTASPAVAPGAISVAASIDGGLEVLGLEVHEPEAVEGVYEAVESAIGVPLVDAGPLTGDLAVADPLIACDEETEEGRIDNPEELAGNIAFVQRGTCFFSEKHLAVQEAGATGIVVFNNVEGEPIAMGGDSAGIEIPGVMISLADGELLMEQLQDEVTVTVTMSADITIPRPDLADTLADFTSRGPGSGSTFKPEVAAPGFAIRSAAVGTGDGSAASSGTSMAAPHVAGLAALMIVAHGEVEDDDAEMVDAIKSMIVNTTVPAAADYPLALQGVGVVRADRAVTTDVFTTPAVVSFGRHNPLEPTTVTESVTVTNIGDESRTFTVDFEPFQEVPGVTISHDPEVTVAAGETSTFDVTLDLDPAAMPPDEAFFSQTEVDGWLELDDGDLDLRTGVLAVVDPAAAVETEVLRRDQRQTELAVANPSDTVGLAHAFTLIEDGDDVGGVTEALGARTGVISGFDVVQLGLATDAWESLSSRETQILLDVDPATGFDYALVAVDLGLIQGLPPTGNVVTALFDLATGAGTLQWFVDGDYHNRVQTLTVDRFPPFGFLEEDAGQRFDYLAATFDRGALVGLQEGHVDLARNVDGRDNPSLSLPPGAAGTLEFPAQDRREVLWLYPNNLVADQFQTTRLHPSGGAAAPTPPDRGGPPPAPPGRGPN